MVLIQPITYSKNNKSMINEEQCYSWFRDQFYTLERSAYISEVSTWFEDLGFNIIPQALIIIKISPKSLSIT